MTQSEPFYKKSTLILLGIILFVYVLYILADVLVPIAFSVLLAILLNPLYSRLIRLRVPKVLAITLTLLIAIIALAGLLYFLSSQIAQFSDMAPVLKEKFSEILTNLQTWVQRTFGITLEKQLQLLRETASSGKALAGQTVSSVMGIFGILFLIPVYVFLFLFYKPLILNFIFEAFSRENTGPIADILQETKTAIQSYIVGLLIEASIVAVLNSIALTALGVKYGILLGVIGAILNLIPYVGGIIAIILPVLMATLTKDGYTTQLLIVGAYALIQFIDNNILVPRIVSSKVKINALASILAVLFGGALWGFSGMFLSIPFVAVLKIVFDRIDSLKPWGKLLGDQIPDYYGTMQAKTQKNLKTPQKVEEQKS
ncbi:AI-2E family transporter [Adhaeribacter radiodurans]|uniref:AI-2E family transporter n=1 Tax=Adhaeribacter radiodurans TaxID=2745197 RepID=A0A7L7L8S8_9BACT|nr:AI-2E family transporter [Adhaeribacter radiodurans]QMU29236.1 AI-2E family transporter [Adhaeribacter radiodurans]